MPRTYVVAELGGCAEGDLAAMLRQVEAVAEAGANAVKAQWVSSPVRLAERRHVPDSYLRAYQFLHYPIEWLDVLRSAATTHGLEFGCSAYLPEDVWMIAPHVDFFKIASFEVRDTHLIRTMTATGKPLFISLGMGTRQLEWFPDPHDRVRFLHCVSAYPAPLEACQLACLRQQAGCVMLSGFSDHTGLIQTGAFAVCAGAQIIEVHLRLFDTSQRNLDYACALDPDAFRSYVSLIRMAEQALGDGVRVPQPCETSMLQYRVTGDADGPTT